MLIADTGALLASIDRNDPSHPSVRAVLESERATVIVPEPVLIELDYLVLKNLGAKAEEALLEDVLDGVYTREPLSDADLRRALALVRQYREQRIGLVDASVVAIAERLNAQRILTLDLRHFRAFRFKNRRPFTLLPADM